MLPIDKLRAVTHIVTHKNCPDGVASAMILKDVLPDAKLSFQQYDDPEHENHEPEPGVLFCDFSPHSSRVNGWVEAGAIVLDHHKSAEEVVAKFGELGRFADEKAEPGICGATLAFREVWYPLSSDDLVEPHGIVTEMGADRRHDAKAAIVAEFATLAGIRDTWQTKDPRWLEGCHQAEALAFWPHEELLGLSVGGWAEKLVLGPTLFKKRLKRAQDAIDNGYRFVTPSGRKVIVFEGLRPTSDAANTLDDDPNPVDLVVGFGFVAFDNKIQMIFSTRSHTDFDCQKFCKAHGGGGHLRAAGITIKDYNPLTNPNPYAHIQTLLADWKE